MPVSERTRLATLKARSSSPSSHPQRTPLDLCDAVGVFELAQNLRLAHHHGIQAGSYAEEVVNGVLPFVPVKVRADRGHRDHPRFVQEFIDQRARVDGVFGGDGDFDPVAGGQNARLRNSGSRLQGLQSAGQGRFRKSQTFPDFDGGGLVADACNQQLHGFNSVPNRACATQVMADRPTTTITMIAALRPRHPAVTRRTTMAK